MHPLILTHREAIAALCRQFGVRRLEVFGSLLREDFNSGTSDVDLVVEFQSESNASPFDRYFGLKKELEALFDRAVDLVELDAMANTRLKRLIERSKVSVYATPA